MSRPPLLDHALSLLRQVLDAEQPMNVDRTSVTVTSYGPQIGAVVVPHQDLGGFSLVLLLLSDHLELLWAGVTDLTYQDDVVTGPRAIRLDGPDWGGDQAVKAALSAELRRPIHTTMRRSRILRRWRLSCAIEVSGKVSDVYVRDVQPPAGHGGGNVVAAGSTSLSGPDRPVVRWPVPLEVWRRLADPAWETPSEAP